MRSEAQNSSLRSDLKEVINNRQNFCCLDEVFEELTKLVNSTEPTNLGILLRKPGMFKLYRATGHLDSKEADDCMQQSNFKSDSPRLLSKSIPDRDLSRNLDASEWQENVFDDNSASKQTIKSACLSQQENPSIEEEWLEERKGIIMPEDMNFRVKIPAVNLKDASQHLQIEHWSRSIAVRSPKSELKANPTHHCANKFTSNERDIFEDSISSFDGNLGGKLSRINASQNFNSLKNLDTQTYASRMKNRINKLIVEESTVREVHL